ncbi:MAG: radical SAM protein [Prevotellaceae bacterium]|jgi:wyosine [tRNA(Phe)-imidazoG37] synthetase (radical SAM superfamily)|nr:radical SAM protein [Prevotellaceae bacterium]
MLFDKIIFGPVKSRRLGSSLGVNLLPENGKVCSFDCIYCECGFNFVNKEAKMPNYEQIISAITAALTDLVQKDEKIDTITFAGNGEPTMHKDFGRIIDFVVDLRNDLMPDTKISVLSNATFSGKETVFKALNKVDNNILKLDSAIEKTVRLINQPSGEFSIEKLISDLQKFNGNLIVQTLFFSGTFNGVEFDNTSAKEVTAWVSLLKKINPRSVMIYTLDRPTPARNLQKANEQTLKEIAQKVEKEGIKTQING